MMSAYGAMRVLKKSASEVLRGDGGVELRWTSKSGGVTSYGAPKNETFATTCRCGREIVVTGDALVRRAWEPAGARVDSRFDEAGCAAGYDLVCPKCKCPQRWVYTLHENPPWSGRFFAAMTWVYVPRDRF